MKLCKACVFRITVTLVLALCVGLASCADTDGASGETGGGAAQKLRIVATAFPQYDWARRILGERLGEVELTWLADSGVDLHSYQPTTDDVIALASCDLLIYGGGASEEWVADAAQSRTGATLVLMDALGGAVVAEERAPGMQGGHDYDGEDGHESQGGLADEHIWLSLRNAQALCGAIADALCELDMSHAEEYRANAAAYTAELAALDGRYAEMVSEAARDVLLFADRFPFRYLVDDYGLRYYAAFAGCSAETEASFETVVTLAAAVDELGLSSVLVLEGSDDALARTVIGSTAGKRARVLALDSLQSVSAADAADGEMYLAAMERNLDVLREALN